MSGLKAAPQSLRYDDVTLQFDRATEGDASAGLVPGYRYHILNAANEEVGHINFRVGDSDHVRFAAGHIGFEIKEPHRGHGYARKACLAIEPWIAEINPKVLITADPDNLPSLRTIERIGAVFLDEIDVPEGDPHYVRGSRRKKRFEWTPRRQNEELEEMA